jgi:saccharopine dehydrogenase-like NADP-dependent oxidoreductase
MRAAGLLGLLDERASTKKGETYRDLLIRLSGRATCGDAVEFLSDRLRPEEFVQAIEGLRWLGLLEDDPIPDEAESALQVLVERMEAKLQYREGERDMVVLRHRFEADYPDGSREEIISTLVDHGIPGGDSAMARTVGLPVAVAAKLILEKKIGLAGLHIPIQSNIYLPILKELKTFDITFQESRSKL